MTDSQYHRPGAAVSHSPASYAKKKLCLADNLEKQLNDLPDKHKAHQQPKASNLRVRLCELLSDVLLTDPKFAIEHDCINRLWKGCFYEVIGYFRQRISREKRKPTSKKDPSSLVPRYEKFLKRHLQEAVQLYEYLISQYHAKLLPSDPQSAPVEDSQESSQTTLDSQPPLSTDTTGVVPGLYRMYIHLGDLYRYDANYSQAQTQYGNASKLAPGQGNPYNQLAVVTQLKDTESPLNTVALYWYARSLLTTHEPFGVSNSNLARLYQTNRDFFRKLTPPPEAVLKPSTDGNGGRELAKAQRAAASRYFLSQFVDVHYSFFQGKTKLQLGPNNKDNDKGLSDEAIVQQIEALSGPFAVLLRASAFGDALLCKMVAICAFSEFHHPDPPNSTTGNNNTAEMAARTTATTVLARTNTLAFGVCLAERAAVGIAKIKDQPEKMGNPGKAPPSVRLLLPLLLLCEYIEKNTIELGMDTNNTKDLSPRARAFCEKTFETFWQRVIEVMNLLTHLRGPLRLDTEDVQDSRLKEFDNFIGYSPFRAFLDDAMASSREDGFASVDEAAEVLNLRQSQTQDSTSQQASTQDSMSGSAQSVEEYRIKVARFLAFGDRMASNDDVSTVIGRRFERTSNGSYKWTEQDDEYHMDTDDDDDNPMMDAENVDDNNDTQPPSGSTKIGGDGGDVLTYSVPEGGGPALLVPGMLLQTRAMATVGVDNKEPEARVQTSPIPPVTAPIPGLLINGAGRNESDPMLHQPAVPPAHAPPPQASALPPPPPGFGSAAIGPPPSTATTGVATAIGHTAALPMDFGHGFAPSMQQPGMQLPPMGFQPTIGTSYDLFGGPEAARTGNPFAASSMPQFPAGPYVGAGGGIGGAGMVGSTGPLFMGTGSSGPAAESTLFGSGLLDSLFDDGEKPKTNNPFAT